MPGTILEILSNRKLIVILSIILIIQFVSFLIGALVAPAPSNAEQVLATLCLPDDYNQPAIPRHIIKDGQIIPKNCKRYHIGENSSAPIVFAFQMPLPREGYVLDYSRWMSNLIALLTPDIIYRSYPYASGKRGDPKYLNGTLEMKVSLAAKNIGDKDWKIIAFKNSLKRFLDCKVTTKKLEDDQRYDCSLIQLFELQSLYYDYYLINLQFISTPELVHAELTGLNLIAIHQNGGFTKVWLSLKTVFFVVTLLTLIWFWNRLRQRSRETTLLERTLIMLGICITQLNVPLEFLSLFFDLGFMNFLSDIRQGILYCALLSFWCIFTGEHLLDGISRSRISSYCKQLSIVLTASIALLVFDSIERGIQWIDPFFTIWEVDSHLAVIFIITAIISAAAYFIYLCYLVWCVRRNISTKQSSLPSLSLALRLKYQGTIYRFKFLLWATIITAGATLSAYITSQFMDENFQMDEDSYYRDIQWSSAMYTTVYAMWNCYIIILLILYAPSHKGLGPHDDNLSEAIEFNRLTSEDHNGSNGDVSSTHYENHPQERVASKGDKSDMQLLQELTSKQSID